MNADPSTELPLTEAELAEAKQHISALAVLFGFLVRTAPPERTIPSATDDDHRIGAHTSHHPTCVSRASYDEQP